MFVGWLSLAVTTIMAANRRDVRRAQELQAQGEQSGWITIDPAQAPLVIAPHVHWRKPSLVMMHPGDTGEVWYVWHHWMTGAGRSARRHDRSRFLTSVPWSSPLPDVTVKRRSAVSAWVLSVRHGASADAFNRAFVIIPLYDRLASAVVHPVIRAALLSGTVPAFEVQNNLVWIDYKDHTRPDMLDYRAQTVAALAALLVAAPAVDR
jgi:hypothetical protein